MRCAKAVAFACATFLCGSALALPDDAAVKALLDERIAQKRAMGLAAVLMDQRGVRIVTAGVARNPGWAIAADTEFEIGSLTKTFTALLLASLVVKGDAALDDPVTKYVPGATGLVRDGKAVTLGQLATHTSGLPRLPGNIAPSNAEDPYAAYGGAKLLDYVAGDVLKRTPGTEYEYSNLGAGLLGFALAEKQGGFQKVLRDRVLSPLGMNDTTVVLSPAQRERSANGHNAELRAVPPWQFQALAGAGALRSTPSDMAKYLKAAIDADSPQMAAAWKLATQPIVDGPVSALRVGLAWHITTREGRAIVWHNGRTGGFASMMAFDPQSREGIVVLSNVSVSVDDLALHLLDSSIPLSSPPKPRVAVQVDEAVLDRIAGRYELAPGFVITIRRDGDRMFAQVTGQREAEIFAESNHEFFYKIVDAQISFTPVVSGNVQELVLHQGGSDVTARRIVDGEAK